MNELKTSSDEEGEEESSAEEDVQTLRCKGKTPANGLVARKKRAYVEIEYEQETEPAAKSRAARWWMPLEGSVTWGDTPWTLTAPQSWKLTGDFFCCQELYYTYLPVIQTLPFTQIHPMQKKLGPGEEGWWCHHDVIVQQNSKCLKLKIF